MRRLCRKRSLVGAILLCLGGLPAVSVAVQDPNAAPGPATLPDAPPEPEGAPAQTPAAVELFDGETLTGWRGEEGLWRIEDGVIVGETLPDRPLEANSFLVFEGELPGDFELRVRYRILSGNSGIQFRSEEVAPFRIRGYQADIDSKGTYTGILYEERARGILCERGRAIAISPSGERSVTGRTGLAEDAVAGIAVAGEWHEYLIRAVGPSISLSIDGHVTAEIRDEQADAARREGRLALQLHAGPPMRVEFAQLSLTPAEAEPDQPPR